MRIFYKYYDNGRIYIENHFENGRLNGAIEYNYEFGELTKNPYNIESLYETYNKIKNI